MREKKVLRCEVVSGLIISQYVTVVVRIAAAIQ